MGIARPARHLAIGLGLVSMMLALATWLAPGASAAVTAQTMDVEATPSSQSETERDGVSLNFVAETTYDALAPPPNPTPVQRQAVLHFDDDFAFDTTGIETCDATSLDGTTTAEALDACPDAVVGFGTASFDGFLSGTGDITAFNGVPDGGDPVLLFHARALGQTIVLAGVLSASTMGADFGSQLDISVPDFTGTGVALTTVDATLDNIEPSPGQHLVSARCNDPDETWNYAGDFTFTPSFSTSASDTQACQVALPQRTLTVTPSGSGFGTVTGPGIDCPGDCTESYDEGMEVTLTQTPDGSSTFTGWSGDCSGTDDCDLTMDSDKAVTAAWEEETGELGELFVDLDGFGSGTVTGPGIDCPDSSCFEDYPAGTMVTLTATPDPGSTFAGWHGNCAGTGTCQLTVAADNSFFVTATFSLAGSGATLTGVVREPASAGSDPLANAWVAVCRTDHSACASDEANATGVYSVNGLPAGNYDVTAYPPVGPNYLPGRAGPIAVSGTGTFNQDVALGPVPQAPPPGTTITPATATRDGIPSTGTGIALTLATIGCPGGSASYEVVLNGALNRSGPMAESPGGSGNYSGVIAAFTEGGTAIVTITIDCPGAVPDEVTEFGLYIDPSGVVRNAQTNALIAGATVTLFRSDDPAGPFVQVPDGSAIMSPSNRTNPDTTDANGHFGWDVLAGYYKVRASAPGCSAAETAVLTIPPPVTDLDIGLSCPTGGAAPPSSTPTPLATKKCKKGFKKVRGKCKKKKKKKK